ncbi:MAG TPA: hypothetical protein V6D05_14855 [Stenomitos sp.]
MRCGTALLLSSMMVLTPLATEAAPLARPVLGPDGQPLVVTAQVPTAAGIGLSFAMPGGAQLYLGETTKGWAYAGSAVGLGAALALGQHLVFFSGSSFVPPEQIAAELLQGMVISWLGVGLVSALDAHHSLTERQPALQEAP